MMRLLRILVLLLNCILMNSQNLSFSRIFPGHQKNSPLHILNSQEKHFFVIRYNRTVHDLVLEKRAKPSADLIHIYPLKLDSVNAHWFDYEQLDYVLWEDKNQLYFVFEKVLNNEVALFMKVLDSTGMMSGFIPVYAQKSNPGGEIRIKFSADAQQCLQIVAETTTNQQTVRKTVLRYHPAQRKIISKFNLPPENFLTGYSQQHVISASGDLYYLQTLQEITGYDRQYSASGNVVVPRIQTDSLSLVCISSAQVLKRRPLPSPLLSQLHLAKIIPDGPQVFFVMHATPLDSVPFFYLSRLSGDLSLIDFIHTQNLDADYCKMLKYYDGSDDASPGGKTFRNSAVYVNSNKASIWEERVVGNYHKEILLWQADLETGRVTAQYLIPRKLFFFPQRTYFRQLNQFMRINDTVGPMCFLLENRYNKREAPQEYHHRHFEKQTQLRHGALVQYQTEGQRLKKKLLYENADFDFIPLRYTGWEKDLVFYFNTGKNERFAILKDYR